jgi:uncharacterized membrane protein YeaQ/YmgE (transglycosylase-associated protein family)
MGQMGWLAWLLVGAIAGWLASLVVTSRLGLVGDIVVGIVGAFLGGFLFSLFGASGTTTFNIWSIFVSFVGAVILLLVIRVLNGRQTVTSA